MTFKCDYSLNYFIFNDHKGQLISECPFDFPKNHRKIWQISALESNKIEGTPMLKLAIVQKLRVKKFFKKISSKKIVLE